MKVIGSHILVESRTAETDEEFCMAMESMVHEVYGHRPRWLEFSAGTRFVRGDRYFREFVCMAGSVALFLMQRARRDGGFKRAIIYRADEGRIARAYEICGGTETGFSPDELHAA